MGRTSIDAEEWVRRPPVVELRNAVVRRGSKTILDIRSLELREGEHVAILGPNGAGKSTLVRLLSRDVRPLAHPDGSAAILLRGRQRWEILEARKLLGVVSSDLQEAFERPIRVRDAVLSGFFGSVGLYRHQDVKRDMLAKADDLIDLLGIGALSSRMMDTLSTGEARRTLIARALVHSPAILVLDEPCDGLDPNATFLFLRTIRGLAEAGRTLVLVTHHIDDIVPEVGRVIMLKEGSIFGDGPTERMLDDETLSALYDIPAHVERRDGWHRLWPGDE